MLKKELIYYLVITCISSSNLEAGKKVSAAALDIAASELSHETSCLTKAYEHTINASYYLTLARSPTLGRCNLNNGNTSFCENSSNEPIYMNLLPQQNAPKSRQSFSDDGLDLDPSKNLRKKTAPHATFKKALIVFAVILALLGLGGIIGFFSHHLIPNSNNNNTSEVFLTSTMSSQRTSTQEIPFFTTERTNTYSKPNFSGVRWTDMRKQFECEIQPAYEGQQCQMALDNKAWHESPVTSSDPNCSYTQKISCPENLNLQGADCWLKECSGESLQGEIWEAYKRFQISYQYDWEAHIKTWPQTSDSGSVALPKDLREICSDQIMLWPKHVLGLQKNSKPYLIHASIGTFPNKGTTKDWNTSGGPEKFTTNQEVIEGNIWLQESHFNGRLGKGEVLCSHEFGHFFIAPENPQFKLWSVNEGEKISFKGPKAMAFFGGPVPLGDAAHWAQNMKHASTGEAISGLPMSGDLHNWKISNLTLWAMEDMGVETTVSKNSAR
ncbi:MAG: hypothetical protein ACRCUQ_03920 [Alphaproteobacteria bacterium]